MSMYNAIFGNNPFAWMHLVAIGTTTDDVPRLRDCYLFKCEDGKTRILVLTRTGSSEYDGDNEAMHELSGFHSTRRLTVDGIYRVFLYDMPFDDYEERIRPLVEAAVDQNGKRESYEKKGGFESVYGPDPDEKWATFMQQLEQDADTPDVQRAKEVGREIFQKMGLI